MNKIRLFVANEPEPIDGVTCWRMYWPLDDLERTYSDTLEIRYSRGNLIPADIYWADVVMCFRPSEPSHLTVLQVAKLLGKKILLDYDDDLTAIPVGHPGYWKLGTKADIVKQAVSMADMVWVSTEALKKTIAHPNAIVVPNAVYPEILPEKPADFKNKTAMWAGSDAHREDADAFKPEYAALLRVVQRFLWVNFMPTWATTVQSQAKIELSAWIHTHIYFEWIRQNGVVAIWKPLITNQFNECKSNIAWITATIAGGVCVTNQAGNRQWENAVKSLPKTEKEFVSVWEASAERVRKEYDLRAWNEVRYRELLKLTQG